MDLIESIALALRCLESDHDTHLAIFALRDLPEVAKAGLTDLAWSMYKYGCADSEVRWFLEELQKAGEVRTEVENEQEAKMSSVEPSNRAAQVRDEA